MDFEIDNFFYIWLKDSGTAFHATKHSAVRGLNA